MLMTLRLTLVTSIPVWLFSVLKKRKVEEHGDFIQGPISLKEYKDTMAKLNGSRTNRVFEFFKITTLERVGFAKHHEAAERKAATIAAAGSDTVETATYPRAGGATPKKTSKKAPFCRCIHSRCRGKSPKEAWHPSEELTPGSQENKVR
jgi:hypothetical protein